MKNSASSRAYLNATFIKEALSSLTKENNYHTFSNLKIGTRAEEAGDKIFIIGGSPELFGTRRDLR